jgi:cytochrome c556
MNKTMKRLCLSAAALAALTALATAFAQQAPRPEQLIKWRQSAYQVLAWSTGKVKANVDGQYNKDEVIRAANALAGVANSNLLSLFAPGTESGKGWHDTAVKAEAFKDTQRFSDLAADLGKQASELARVAQTGDVAAVKAQLGKVQHTCKGCHDDFRSKD